MPYFPNVLLFHLVPLDHRFSLEETAVFVVEESLLAEKMGLLFSLRVLQVLFVFGYSFLFLFLRCAVVLIHFLHAYRVKKNKTLLRITATRDLEDLLLLATPLPFSSQKDTKMSRHKGNQTHSPAMPSPTASRAALTHQEEQEEMAITHKCLKAEHCSKEKTENTTAGEALTIQKREWVKILGSLPSSAPVLQRSPAWA